MTVCYSVRKCCDSNEEAHFPARTLHSERARAGWRNTRHKEWRNMLELKSIEEEAADCRAAWAAAPHAKVAHCYHHDIHIESLNSPPEGRIQDILENKPIAERALRLRLFRPYPLDPACADWRKADANQQQSSTFIAKHARLFPDCTLDGKSIFPAGWEEVKP